MSCNIAIRVSFIALLVCVLVAFCLTGCIASSLWQAENWQQTPYLFLSSTTATDGVNIFFTFFLLNSSFIPVSLYVTVRLARTFQMLFMERDAEMYFEDPEVVQVSSCSVPTTAHVSVLHLCVPLSLPVKRWA